MKAWRRFAVSLAMLMGLMWGSNQGLLADCSQDQFNTDCFNAIAAAQSACASQCFPLEGNVTQATCHAGPDGCFTSLDSTCTCNNLP